MTKFLVTSGIWMSYRNPQLSYQVTAGISITLSPQHLFSCLLLSFLRSASCAYNFPIWQFLVQPLECCTPMKHSTPKASGIHNQLQKSSGLPKSMDNALLLKLHLSPFWDSWCLGPLSPWQFPPDMAEPLPQGQFFSFSSSAQHLSPSGAGKSPSNWAAITKAQRNNSSSRFPPAKR